MTSLRVLSTLGVAGVMQALMAECERRLGVEIVAEFLPTALLMQRIRGGEAGDVAILTQEAIEELIAGGRVLAESRVDLVRSQVGVAVQAGAPHPAIGSAAAFVATMLAAKSVAMSKAGASGIFMAGLLERLGIADAVAAKATIIPSGFTGELLVRGEVEIAIQQVSELMAVPGIDIVGPLPADIAGITVFTAGIFSGCAMPGAAAGLIAMLASAEVAALFETKGLEPLAGGAS